MALGIEAYRDPGGISREATLKLIPAENVKMTIACRSHVEPAVAQHPELPVTTRVVPGQLLGERAHDRLQANREPCAEVLGDDGQPPPGCPIFRDRLSRFQ
jgi:hypothetical protein